MTDVMMEIRSSRYSTAGRGDRAAGGSGPFRRAAADRRGRPAGSVDEADHRVRRRGEMYVHLGYAKHDPAGRDGGNSRNGARAKTVLIFSSGAS